MTERTSAPLALAFALAGLLFAGPALAQDEAAALPLGELSLEQAIAIALERNPMLAVADAEVASAKTRVDEAEGSRLPRVELSETISRTTNPVMVFGGLLSQENFSAANFDVGFLNEPDALNNFATRVLVEQPIWTGGRIAGALEAARAGDAAAEAGRASMRQHVARGVIDAYSGAVLAQRYLDVARQALTTAASHVKMVTDLRQAGLVVEADLLKAKVRESEVAEMVIEAESGVAIARAGLALAIGLDADTVLMLPDDVALVPAVDESLDALEAEAFAKRPDLLAIGEGANAARGMVRSEKAGFLPQIGAGGFYEANAEDAPGTDGMNWGVMVSARMTLWDGTRTRARVRQAEAMEARLEATLANARSQTSLEIRQAWHALRAARQRVDTADGAVAMAEESLRTIEDRYRNGLVTLVELQDTETALTAARTRAVAARRDVLASRAALDLAVGRL